MRLFLVAPLMLALLPATGAEAQTAYDLLFRPGTLSSMEGEPADKAPVKPGDTIVYDNTHSPGSAVLAPKETVKLTLVTPTEASLELERGQQHRALGRFPARVGNPMVMYFLEGVLKDISDETGGSPFYLRNRLKEALAKPVDATPKTVAYADGKVEVQSVTMTPLANASEKAKLGRFADLKVTVLTSDAVPGGYLSFIASAPAGSAKASAPYENSITLRGGTPEAVR